MRVIIVARTYAEASDWADQHLPNVEWSWPSDYYRLGGLVRGTPITFVPGWQDREENGMVYAFAKNRFLRINVVSWDGPDS